eukprot:6601005-Ditylum_brightwellii.AAC.1
MEKTKAVNVDITLLFKNEGIMNYAQMVQYDVVLPDSTINALYKPKWQLLGEVLVSSSQFSYLLFATAVPGLFHTVSNVGTNMPSWMTARQRIILAPVESQATHAYAHTTE